MDNTTTIQKIVAPLLALPFDIMRANYAFAVKVGLVKQSLIASSRFSKGVHQLETQTLGPWARCV